MGFTMTLADFLATASTDDNQAHSEAIQHTSKQGFLFNENTMNSLLWQSGLRSSFDAIASQFEHPWYDGVKGIISSTEYNFREDHPVGQMQLAGLQGMIDAGVQVEIGGVQRELKEKLVELKTLCLQVANKTVKPFENITLEEVKAIRNPAYWLPVTIDEAQIVTPESDLISNSDRAGFRFNLHPGQSFTGKVEIRIFAKKQTESNFLAQSSYPITVSGSFAQGEAAAHFFKRPPGLAGYRHFKFEFLPPFAGALTEVSAEGVG